MLFTLGHCQTVAPFILRVTGVSLDPDDLHLMAAQLGEQLFPQIGVERRFAVGFFPATLFPAVDPAFLHTIAKYLESL